jgi:hypothetical protein
MGIARVMAIVSFLSYILLAAAAPRHASHHNVHVFEDYEDLCGPYYTVGRQKCHDTGFDTCVPGGEWVYQDCAPGTACVEGFGAAKWHIWCLVPPQ